MLQYDACFFLTKILESYLQYQKLHGDVLQLCYVIVTILVAKEVQFLDKAVRSSSKAWVYIS